MIELAEAFGESISSSSREPHLPEHATENPAPAVEFSSVARYVSLFVCLFVCLSNCIFVCQIVCLFVRLYVCLSDCMFVCQVVVAFVRLFVRCQVVRMLFRLFKWV